MSFIAARHARRVAVRHLALGLLARHGLHGWTFAFNRRKQTLGLCRYDVRAVELSLFLVDRNGPEEVRDSCLEMRPRSCAGRDVDRGCRRAGSAPAVGRIALIVPGRCRRARPFRMYPPSGKVEKR